jgi:NAD-dependent deacetylase
MQIDISRYYSIVALTGAGISAGSGLRTYRGPGGVWEERNVEEYGNIRPKFDEAGVIYRAGWDALC